MGAAASARPVPAGAAEGLYLTWRDCAQNGAGSRDRLVLCTPTAPDHVLYCAFTLAQPVDQAIGIEVVVDYQVADSLVPEWWRYGVLDCREGSLTASEDFTADTACVDPWNDAGTAVIQDFQVGEPRGGANQARIRAVAAVPSVAAAALAAGPMYYGLKLVIDNASGGLCGGCTTPVCLVLNSIWLKRIPGAPGGDLLLQFPGAGDGNWATWHGDALSDCAAVPVRRPSWGRLKSLYR